ncbi:hypothetical protein DE146DRAFT_523557 [Phaeosphaeria sp. MPI-PUGE-AT-0046c]|nr:hypothetical protein DE146DRAFT_523557 [Phaeosphaeria sp. MPI-PUGE-AT-0046c]
MPQPTMRYYGVNKPQYPIQVNQNQQLGDFTTENRNIWRARDRACLEKHFEHHGNSGLSHPAPHSSYIDRGLSQGERHHISQAKSATRAALGPSFDFDDDSFERSRRHMDDYQRSKGWTDEHYYGNEARPQNFIDEFNLKCHENDEDNGADQYLADHREEAPWRNHEASKYHVPSRPALGVQRMNTVSEKLVIRTDSGYGSMTSLPNFSTPERPGTSHRLRGTKFLETSDRAKQGQIPQTPHFCEQAKRLQTSYRAEQRLRTRGAERPKTPIPGLILWDVSPSLKQSSPYEP